MRKIPGRRMPVKGFMGEIKPNEHGYYVVRERKLKGETTPVIVADSSAWKAVRKARVKSHGRPIIGFCDPYHNRLLFSGDCNLCISASEERKGGVAGVSKYTTRVLIVDARFFRIVRKANVKPLKPRRKAPHAPFFASNDKVGRFLPIVLRL